MRNLLLILVLIFGSLNVIAQQKSKLVGQWKVIALKQDQLYVDFEDELAETDDQMLAMYHELFGQWQYCFLKDGKYAMLRENTSVITTGTYVNKAESNMIQVRFLSDGEMKTISYNCRFTSNGNLLLTNADKDGFTLVMRKVDHSNRS